jgi:hypothetical protein
LFEVELCDWTVFEAEVPFDNDWKGHEKKFIFRLFYQVDLFCLT